MIATKGTESGDQILDKHIQVTGRKKYTKGEADVVHYIAIIERMGG